MGIGASLFLIAVGAILAFAVTAEVSGLDIEVVGWILMALGGVGILLSCSSGAVGADGGEAPDDGPRPPQPPY